jgi:glycosyltransferase involved in cell wall biosynthesis
LRSTGPSPWLPLEVRSLAGIVRRFRPEVVHLHSSKAGLAGRLLLRRRLPTLFQPHSWSFLAVEGPVARATLAWERAGARWADVIVCVSDDERRVGEERGIHPPGYRVFPHGVDLERWPAPPAGAREQARAGLGLDTAPLAVCVGRLHRQKRQHALLDIWPQVREAVPGARLALVGDGPDRAALEARAVEGVSFAGAVDDVREWLLAASLVVQPSKWEAGVPLSVMEALACGRGVVATDAPGLRDIGRDLPGTPVVPVDDEVGLRDAIAERLANPDRADREGAAGRAFAEARDDLGRQMAGIRGLYEEIVEGRSRA